MWPAGETIIVLRVCSDTQNLSFLAWLTSLDQKWPTDGEIDILEGVHNDVFNAMTLHTIQGCTLDTSRAKADKSLPASANTFVGNVSTTDCNTQINFNQGCSIKDTDPSSFGIGLNRQQGGVFATLWDEVNGIKICTSIP